MKRLALILSLSLAAPPGPVLAATKQAGTSSGEFLKFGPDARGVAMGHAMSAVAEDSAALYWNPAGLAMLTRSHVTATHAFLFQDVFYDYAAFARPIAPLVQPRRRFMRPSVLGSLAISLQYLNAGRLEERINTGQATGGTFTPRDLAFTAGWGSSLSDSLDVGLALKYIDSRIQKSARTGAIDAGVRFRSHLYDWPWTLAAAASNFGGALRFDAQRDPLPITFRFGNSIRPADYLILAGDLIFTRDNRPYPALGAEGLFAVEESLILAIRGGYNGRIGSNDLDGVSGISFGLGMRMRSLQVDYAWRPFGALGQTHRLTLGYAFGKTIRR